MDSDDSFTDDNIDITDSKTFKTVSVLCILFGCMIGAGFHLLFSILPPISYNDRFQIVVMVLISGFILGSAIKVIVDRLKYRGTQDDL